MLTLPTVFALFILLFVVLYWQFRMRSKEFAFAEAAAICRKNNFQLLDDSISFTRINLQKYSGKLILTKSFEFEYADAIGHRKSGLLLFYKRTLLVVKLDNIIIDHDNSDNTSNVIPFPKNLQL